MFTILKTLSLSLVCSVLLFTGQAWGQDFKQEIRGVHPIYKGVSVFKSVVVDRESLIRQWAASGEICRVLGHRWEAVNTFFVYDGYKFKESPETRRCSICGKTETRRLTEWE